MSKADDLPKEVLAAFRLEATTAVNKGGIWSVAAAEGEVFIKEYKDEPALLPDRLSWIQYLRRQGVNVVPALLENIEGGQVFRLGNTLYCGWLQPQGEAFTPQNQEHLLSVIKSLALVHKYSGLYEQEQDLPKRFEWPLLIQSRLTDLIAYSRHLEEYKLTDDFQRVFRESFDFIYDQGQEAIQKMILANCEVNCSMNFVFLLDGFLPEEIVLADGIARFCSCLAGNRGPRVQDLANFMCCYMGQHCWDLGLVKKILRCYQEIVPLSTVEKNLLLSMMRFPSRYWLFTCQYLWRDKKASEMADKLINLIYEMRLRDRCLDALEDSLLREGEVNEDR